MNELVHLFLAFLRAGSLAVGGAYTFIPTIEYEVVDRYGWLTEQEYLEVFGLTEGIPGAISIKMATFVGYRVAGIPGALAANLGNLMVPALFSVALYFVLRGRLGGWTPPETFTAGVQAATWGVLLAFAWTMAQRTEVEPRTIAIGVAAAAGMVLFNLHPGLLIVGAGFIGVWLL